MGEELTEGVRSEGRSLYARGRSSFVVRGLCRRRTLHSPRNTGRQPRTESLVGSPRLRSRSVVCRR